MLLDTAMRVAALRARESGATLYVITSAEWDLNGWEVTHRQGVRCRVYYEIRFQRVDSSAPPG